MNALRRASAAWRWAVGLWLGELLIALVGAYGVRNHVAAAMDEYVIPDDHLLYALAELVHAHPQLTASILVSLVTTTLLGFVVWTLLAPLLLLRLGREGHARPRGAAALGAAWLASLGGAVATSAWHLALRIALVVIASQAVLALPGIVAVVLGVIVVLTLTCALDLSRVAVVVDGAPGTSPRTALDGFTALARAPLRTAAMMGLGALGWLVVLAGLVAVVRTGGAALPLMRACAALATFLGLVRLAVALDVPPWSRAARGPGDQA